jgi:UDP-glucose 4-epimerase
MNILVTGGAGYIGSVTVEELLKQGHKVVVYDNLSTGHLEAIAKEAIFVKGDILEAAKLTKTFLENQIEAVIHLAAFALVGESMQHPMKYFQNNVVGSLSLLEAMVKAGVNKIVFSSTCAVYGEPKKLPIEETFETNPTNPYGETKLAVEKALKWFDRCYGIKYISLRYFNAAGASENYGEVHDPETHLIPNILKVAIGQKEHLEVFGADYPTPDGTCIRDYVHVIDIALAHIKALNFLDGESRIFNIGCGGGYSVNQVIKAAENVTGKKIKVVYSERRAGDPPILVASSEKIQKELGWKPQFQDLEQIINSAWTWMKKNA